VRIVRLAANEGAAARNIGVAQADTPYVAFADDDSWWAPDALPRAERLLAAHPRLALVAARTLVGPEHRADPTNQLMARSPLGRAEGMPGPSVLGFLACSAVVRTTAFRQAGGFSPLLHFGAEEKLLSYDLAALGWGLCYVEDVIAHHHPSAARATPGARRRLEQRNNLMINWMRRPIATGVRGGLDLLLRTPRDPGSIVALAGAVRRLPWVPRRRERLPEHVERDVRLLEQAGRSNQQEVLCPA
jgi:GT2 family glycosyltransferase